MSLWAIVPVKPLRRGKSRLSGVLSEEERTFLNYTMLGNTMKALSEAPSVAQTLVISRDPAALALARNFGARTVMEDSNSELNQALQRATLVSMVGGANRTLILPADLPLITGERIEALIQEAQKPPEIVIAPDRHRQGTNALLVDPGGLIGYFFGPESFQKHCEQAESKGAKVTIFEDTQFALDLDLPEDLDLLQQMESVPVQLEPR